MVEVELKHKWVETFPKHFALGGNPSEHTEKQITECAKELIEYLSASGGNWHARVHENLGWHYTVFCGTVSVSANISHLLEDKREEVLFHAMINRIGERGASTPTEWYTKERSNDPIKAVQIAFDKLSEVVEEVTLVYRNNRELTSQKLGDDTHSDLLG